MTPEVPAEPTPRQRFDGLYAAVHSPFKPVGRLNAAVVGMQYELLAESGVRGIFLCGTAGEGYSLTVAERRTLLDTWVGVTDGQLPIIAHVGHASIRDAIRLAEHAYKAGAAAVAAMAPSYYRPDTVEQLIESMAPIATAAQDLPFFFYDAPEFNGVVFPAEQVLQWGKMRIPTLAGLKFTSRDLTGLARCLELKDDFAVLVGHEELWLPALALGARGAIGLTFNFAAPVFHRIQETYEAGRVDHARAEHGKATRLVRILEAFGSVRGSKALMSLLGVDCGDVRLPQRALHAREFRDLYEQVRELDLFARPLCTPEELGR